MEDTDLKENIDPQAGFRVKVNDSNRILALAESTDRGLTHIGDIFLEDDPLLSDVQVNLLVSSIGPGRLYSFDSLLLLSDSRREADDGGFLSTDKANAILELMQSVGYQGELRTTTDRQNQLFFVKNGRVIRINLGHPSRTEALRASIPAWIPDEVGIKILSLDERIDIWRERVTNLDEVINYDSVDITLLYPEGAYDGHQSQLPLSQETFPEDLQIYAQALQDVVNVFYRVEGYVSPDRTLTIQQEESE